MRRDIAMAFLFMEFPELVQTLFPRQRVSVPYKANLLEFVEAINRHSGRLGFLQLLVLGALSFDPSRQFKIRFTIVWNAAMSRLLLIGD
jgi:hypothetical protein